MSKFDEGSERPRDQLGNRSDSREYSETALVGERRTKVGLKVELGRVGRNESETGMKEGVGNVVKCWRSEAKKHCQLTSKEGKQCNRTKQTLSVDKSNTETRLPKSALARY